MRFSEIDINTGVTTVINQTPIESGYLAGFVIGGLAFDQATESYIIVTANANGFNLKVIDALTGNVVSSVPAGLFYEIQCDNYTFAKNFYNLTTTSPVLNPLGKIYPNPTQDWLQLDIEAPIQNIVINNINGQVVLQTDTIEGKRISVASIPTGNYIITVQTTEGIFRQQFVKY